MARKRADNTDVFAAPVCFLSKSETFALVQPHRAHRDQATTSLRLKTKPKTAFPLMASSILIDLYVKRTSSSSHEKNPVSSLPLKIILPFPVS